MTEELSEQADRIEAEWYGAGAPSPLYARPDGRIRIVLDAPERLLTMNEAKRSHYRAWAAMTAAWRDAMHARALYLGVPPVGGRVGVEAYPYQLGGNLADAGAHMPCVKACVDGLRDAGVIVDDTGEHVAWVRCHCPVKAPGPGIVLELVRVS